MNQLMKLNRAVKGSVADVAKQHNTDLATALFNVDIIILLDVSSSMDRHDAPGGLSRRQMAEKELGYLQAQYPGRFALIEFATDVEYRPQGYPSNRSGMTDLGKALKFVHPMDSCGYEFVLISDGQPDSEYEALEVAKRFSDPINTIFCGPENDEAGGRKFLAKLAALTGGKNTVTAKVAQLALPVKQLLLNG